METKNILIIEDDEEIIDLIEINMEDLDYEIDKALDGEKGLQKAESNNYDPIILDLMLPKIDGLEVCKISRSRQCQHPNTDVDGQIRGV
ncbi:MAG: response regulator [Balneolaceae bacterium]|nr:response regulator [Balneolaceae bacterium]